MKLIFYGDYDASIGNKSKIGQPTHNYFMNIINNNTKRNEYDAAVMVGDMALDIRDCGSYINDTKTGKLVC